MKGKRLLAAFGIIILLILLIKLLTDTWFEDHIKSKIETALNKFDRHYTFDIEQVQILFLQAGLELQSVQVIPDSDSGGLEGKISSIKISGINPFKALFRHDFEIFNVAISGCHLKGVLNLPKKPVPILLKTNLQIHKFILEDINFSIHNDSNARSYLLANGQLKIYHFRLKDDDTLSLKRIGDFSFSADSICAVTADSIYSLKVSRALYSAVSNTLEIGQLAIQPNFSKNRFMARFNYETDRIDALLTGISIHDFLAINYIREGNIVSAFVRIDDLHVSVYRDKRKEFKHIRKPVFQEILYKYHSLIGVDSIIVSDGEISYSQLVDYAKEPGKITFSKVNARLYNITNDTVFRKKEGYFSLVSKGLLMQKCPMTARIKARLYDPLNTFEMTGSLGTIDAKDLNPMIEKTAFIAIRSGKISEMNYSFRADNKMALGSMKLLYEDLSVTVEDKKTGDSTGLKQKLVSMIFNNRLLNANPLPGKDIRAGEIEQERDPERFLFHYCFRAILSGIRSTILKNPGQKKK